MQDEQERLPDALRSVDFCDEVVVVDGGSSDATVEVARRAGAVVIENPWPGFAAQRNVALDAAHGDWVLEIDADERISPRLRESIEGLLREDPPGDVDMAVFALRNSFLGGKLGPSAKYPAYRSRLFRRGAYRHDESRAVHEGLVVPGRPLILEGDLEHVLADSLGEALADTWRYARLESEHVARPAGAFAYAKGIVLRPALKLVYRTVIDGGWRDGWRGLLKIVLDVSSDALVWTRVLAGGGSEDADGAEQAAAHFGRRSGGMPKVVAVAAGADASRTALGRLRALREQGMDVSLISDAEPAAADVPVRRVAHLGPLALVRALEAEQHIRPTDAVLPFGRRARLVLRVLPGTFRPGGDGLL